MSIPFNLSGRASRTAALVTLVAIVVGCSSGGTPSTAAPTDPSDPSTAPGTAGVTPAGSSAPTGAGEEGTLTLVAYSTPREVYEILIPQFQTDPQWSGVTFEQSYGASGEQSRAVVDGLAADIVALSLAPDVTRLVDAGLIADDWAEDEAKGFVSTSVVVFAVRPGNPKNIASWDDLLRDDVTVINPNPFTSGGAMWNVMAAWGAQIQQGKSEDEAKQYLLDLYQNVGVQDTSAREALQTFLGGQGDVLLAYENESITAQQAGQPLEFVVPAESILIENPIASLTNSDVPETAAAFIEFARSVEGQTVFSEKGYRSILPDVLAQFDYPEVPGLFTIDEFGGWTEVRSKFFDADTGIVAEVERSIGVEP